MAIKLLSGNISPSKAVSALIFPSEMSGLATRDYEDDNFEEVSKGRFLVGTEDVLDVDEMSKCAGKGSLGGEPPTENNSHAADGSPIPRVHTAQPSTSINIFTDTESIKSQNCSYTSGILLVKFNCYLAFGSYV